jgi:hypothetical protein
VKRDALKIIQALQNERLCGSRYQQLIDDAKIVLNSLHLWYAGHIKMETNFAAHHLVKAAINQSLENVWMERLSCIH